MMFMFNFPGQNSCYSGRYKGYDAAEQAGAFFIKR